MKPDRTRLSVAREDMTGSQSAAPHWTAPLASDLPEDRALNALGRAWFAALPKAVQPVVLAESFPRICNRIRERWEHPDLMIPYLDALLMDDRRGRQGFPLTIVLEISNVKEYFLDAVAKNKLEPWSRDSRRC